MSVRGQHRFEEGTAIVELSTPEHVYLRVKHYAPMALLTPEQAEALAADLIHFAAEARREREDGP